MSHRFSRRLQPSPIFHVSARTIADAIDESIAGTGLRMCWLLASKLPTSIKRQRNWCALQRHSPPRYHLIQIQYRRSRANFMGTTLSQMFNGSSQNAPVPLPSTPASPSPQPFPRQQGTDATEVGRLEGISKNQRKKLGREKRLQERKRARKEQRRFYQAKRKAEKRAEREKYLKSLSVEEREQFQQQRLELMRTERAEDKKRRAQVRDVLENHTRYAVCIDLGWNEQMVEKEQRSLARQLSYSYNALRKCVESGMTPLAMSVTGVDSTIKPVLSLAAQGWETWPIKFSEKSLTEFHDKNKLVYLTHDAEEVLHTLDSDMVYVVGGIVDRNRLVGATFNKATDMEIKTARLGLDAEISIQHGTPVLTVNHCIEILVYAANGLTWRDAYMNVLPPRKGINAPNINEI